jgi:hypothetical protein
MEITKAQLIKSLANVPDDEPLAYVAVYAKEDLQDLVNEVITPEIWAAFASELSRNEYLGNVVNDTFGDLLLDKGLTWKEN